MRDILVCAHRLDGWDSGVEYAAGVAAARGASLTAAYVYPTPDSMLPAYGVPALLAEIVEHTQLLEREALAAEGRFLDWAAQRGVKNAAWQVVEGYLPEALAHLGNWHDLVVLERAGDMPWQSAADIGMLAVRIGLPCLVVPGNPPSHDAAAPECVAIAWNGAPEALRAIHTSLAFMQSARRVILLNGERRDRLSQVTWSPAFDVQAYLRRHGIHCECQPLDANDADAGEAILDAATAGKADLLVMGAYGRNRLSEWVFGGATRHVLEHAALPVLMRH